jgi:hypothetical protein
MPESATARAQAGAPPAGRSPCQLWAVVRWWLLDRWLFRQWCVGTPAQTARLRVNVGRVFCRLIARDMQRIIDRKQQEPDHA